MNTHNFIHLRNYTQYSLSQGALKINELVSHCIQNKVPAIGISDKGNLFGSMEFSSECSKNGIQPIICCDVHIVENNFFPGSLLLIASNLKGYQNLSKLISLSYLENEHNNKPWVSFQNLIDHREGIICLSGGIDGLLRSNYNQYGKDRLIEIERYISSIFNNNFFFEIQRTKKNDIDEYNDFLIDYSIEKKVPLVATNENYFLNKDYYESHDVLLCISQQTYVDSENRKKISDESYLKSPHEMNDLFLDLPDALNNTLLLAQKCSFFLEETKPKLPKTTLNLDENDFLKKSAKAGLTERLKSLNLSENESQNYYNRLEFELNIIMKMGYSGYFIIVADFIQWAKKNKIPVGPGRGSGAGSLVAWVLTITDLDPIKFGLIFERFLNPERVSMPDFDIDFCMEKRDEVIKYVQTRYNKNNVAQIITFGSFQARAALRDVGRVLQIPYDQVDKLCKMIPFNPAKPISIDDAINNDSKIKKIIEGEKRIEKLFNISKNLEGLLRHASTHAAGVVISEKPLIDILPLYRDPRSEFPVTQFSMKYVEKVGLIKFDFLGLKTLTVINKTIKLLNERGVIIDLENVDLNDEKTFKLIRSGKTIGVFQFDGKGMRETIVKIKPDRFEDLIAIVSLYRPGPMDNIPLYVKRKNSKEKINYVHKDLKNILDETYGIMVYQEQVMQIAQKVAGFSLAKADLLRRAMGKKIKKEMDDQKSNFIEGCKINNLSEVKAKKLFDEVEKFAGYGFNKSHAAAYALISFQTAYLKANFPMEFLCASMEYDINNVDKLSIFVKEVKDLGFEIVKPDINSSFESFKVKYSDKVPVGIFYALGAIKNIGESSIKVLVEDREKKGKYLNLPDLIRRIDGSVLNKRQFESLIFSGALESIEKNQLFLNENLEKILKYNSFFHKNCNKLQENLFNLESSFDDKELISNKKKSWDILIKLKKEYESIGFFISKHPVEYFEKNFLKDNFKKLIDLFSRKDASSDHEYLVIVSSITTKKSKNGTKYAFFTVSDNTIEIELICFSDVLDNIRYLPNFGELCKIKIDAITKGDSTRYVLSNLEQIDPQNKLFNSLISINLDAHNLNLDTLETIFKDIKLGTNSLKITVNYKNYALNIKSEKKFSLDSKFLDNLKQIKGITNVKRIN